MKNQTKPLKATFLSGHRKTGTTLLLTLLDSHPQLNTFPADSGFFYAYFPPYESETYSDNDRINRIIEFCYGNLKEELDKVGLGNENDFPQQALHSTFRSMAQKTEKLTTPKILLLMLEAYRKFLKMDIVSHKRFVEKTSSSDIYASVIFQWFPDAKFIHMVRDPRDNYASLKSGWKKKYSERTDDIRYLQQSMIERGKLTYELSRFNQNRYGKESYMVLRYEDLTANPEKEMHNIANFLQIDFHESMLVPTVFGAPWDGNNFDGLKFLIPSAINVNRWKERISDQEAMLVEYYFKDIMEHYGYTRVFSINEAIDAAMMQYSWYNYHRPDSV